jgi:hypothetical protein
MDGRAMQKLPLIRKYCLTTHALEEMVRRQISEHDIARVLAAPEQMQMLRPGRAVYQSRIEMGKPAKLYLVRVFVDVGFNPPQVVTAYRTSKIAKYWRTEDESHL